MICSHSCTSRRSQLGSTLGCTCEMVDSGPWFFSFALAQLHSPTIHAFSSVAQMTESLRAGSGSKRSRTGARSQAPWLQLNCTTCKSVWYVRSLHCVLNHANLYSSPAAHGKFPHGICRSSGQLDPHWSGYTDGCRRWGTPKENVQHEGDYRG